MPQVHLKKQADGMVVTRTETDMGYECPKCGEEFICTLQVFGAPDGCKSAHQVTCACGTKMDATEHTVSYVITEDVEDGCDGCKPPTVPPASGQN
jgi:hypothetical protein